LSILVEFQTLTGSHSRIKKGAVRDLEPPDTHHLSAAIGWLELGNCQEAAADLERISPDLAEHPDVITVRQEIFARAGKWDLAAQAAATLTQIKPKQSHSWIALAYATRRKPGGGISAAREILLDAEKRFPKEPLIRYNLACYECQSGNLPAALAWLAKAFALGNAKQFKLMAMEDPDLLPLRDEIAGL
jgi:predicted Zn-dependent protease